MYVPEVCAAEANLSYIQFICHSLPHEILSQHDGRITDVTVQVEPFVILSIL